MKTPPFASFRNNKTSGSKQNRRLWRSIVFAGDFVKARRHFAPAELLLPCYHPANNPILLEKK